MPHRCRPGLTGKHPVHVTVRVRPPVWNLRSRRSFRIVGAALTGVLGRDGFGVTHFSVQGNHIHFIVEAASAAALGAGMKALCVRIARRLNGMMGSKGPVFADRYHLHVLRTPTEVRRALHYVLGNFQSHARRRGEPVSEYMRADPFASGDGRHRQLVTAPSTWLLCTGWSRAPA